jgi:large exoprotein involved in heme utilization and adhesion
VLRDSEVSTSVAGGEDPAAGDITIDPRVLVIDNSVIQADARAGFGGNIRIEADNILVPRGDLAALLARGDISASGETEDVDGTVAIGASEVDLSGGLVVLEGAFVDVSALLRERCAARRDVGASSFTGAGRGGLPPSPDGMLASGLSAGAAAGADAAGAQGFWPAGMADGCAP